MYERSYQAKVLKKVDKNPSTGGKKRPRNKIIIPWKKILRSFVIGIIIASVCVVIRLPYFQINTILINGNVVVDQRDVLDFVDTQLQGNYLKIFPKSSLFLFSSKKTADKIKNQFSRFETVKVKKINNHSITISIEEYKGIYLWCQNSDCFFMDKNGMVFAQAPIFSGNAYVKIYGGTKLDFPFSPISQINLQGVSLMINNLNSFDIKPNSFNFVDDHTLEISFTHNGKDSKIIINPTADFNTSYSTFLSALRTPSFKSSFDSPYKYLEYIDLRFSQKIVYKFN